MRTMVAIGLAIGLAGVTWAIGVQTKFPAKAKATITALVANAEVTPVLDGVVLTALENALNANRTAGDAVAQRVILAARARTASRAAAEQVQRKGEEVDV